MYHSTRAGTAIAMKLGTMKKAKDTRLLITYTTLTCHYCVIIQKKPSTSLSHHAKHTKHHDNVNSKWFYFLDSERLYRRTETTGSCYFFLVQQNHWFIGDHDSCQLYSARIRVIFIIYTIGPQNKVIVTLERWLRYGGVLLPYQKPQSGGAVSFGLHIYFPVLKEIKFCDFCWFDRFGT